MGGRGGVKEVKNSFANYLCINRAERGLCEHTESASALSV